MRRTAVVTGAGRGIGRAVAEALSADTAVVGFDREFPAETPWLTKAVVVDVGDPAAVGVAIDGLDAIDIVVCAAGIIRDRVSWKMTDEEWNAVIDINLSGVFHVLRAATPALRRSNGGRMVLIGSINGLRGRFGQVNYAAAKAGLIGMARTLALELARDGVTVNVVAPGYIDTDMTQSLPEEVRQLAVKRTPLGRMGSVVDVAGLVRFLAGAEASFITGTVIPVDGGQMLGHVA